MPGDKICENRIAQRRLGRVVTGLRSRSRNRSRAGYVYEKKLGYKVLCREAGVGRTDLLVARHTTAIEHPLFRVSTWLNFGSQQKAVEALSVDDQFSEPTTPRLRTLPYRVEIFHMVPRRCTEVGAGLALRCSHVRPLFRKEN